MAFDSSKSQAASVARKSPTSMSFRELTDELNRLSQNLLFEAEGASPRTKANIAHLRFWADMPVDEFRRVKAEARKKHGIIQGIDAVELESGAYVKQQEPYKGYSVCAPLNDVGEYLRPFLIDIIALHNLRLERLDYKNQKETERLTADKW